MCGHDWCSVRISKEITEFLSGNDEAYSWDNAKVSNALTDDQKQILEQRGVLSPDEIHKLAAKTQGTMQGETDAPAPCHSDLTDDTDARQLQEQRLPVVELDE